MDAINLKKETQKHISAVAMMIASFYDEKYRDEIIKKIEGMQYYFYDSNKQIFRLINIELRGIAEEFANEVLMELDLSKERKEELTEKITTLIMDGASKEEIREELSYEDELASNLDKYVNMVLELSNYFNNDYQTKDIRENMDSYTFEHQVDKYNVKFVRQYFGISVDANDASYIIQKFFEAYQGEKEEDLEEFYSLIGCKGKNYQSIIKNAKLKRVYISPQMYEKVAAAYHSGVAELANDCAFEGSNLEDIITDLEGKGYSGVERKTLAKFLAKTSVYRALTFMCKNSKSDNDSFIIYTNSEYVYSPKFTDTFIHEILHYIGTHGESKLL